MLFETLVKMLSREPDRQYTTNVIPEAVRAVKLELLAVIEEAQIVVNDAMLDVDMMRSELSRDVSPPFKTCFIQMPDGMALQSKRESGEVEKFYAVFIHELEPYFYTFAIVKSDPIEPDDAYRLQTGYLDTKNPDHEQHYVWDAILSFLQPFARAHAVGVEKVNERIKFKRDGEKILHKIKRVVHIFPKTKKAKVEAEEKYDIEWSHRWAVRGHWREIKGIGKDRSGEYTVKGFTWVIDHVKGPDDLPYVQKTRVIDEDFFKGSNHDE